MILIDNIVRAAPAIHREVVDEHMADRYLQRWKKEAGVTSSTDDITAETDIAIEEELRIKLEEEFGTTSGFVGEETGDHAEPGQPCWVVDLVDGSTIRLIGGELWSSVLAHLDPATQNIDFVSVYQPTRETQYLYVTGRRSWKETLVHEKERLPRRRATFLSPSRSSALGELRGCAYIPARYKERMPGMDGKLEGIFRYIHHPEVKDGRDYGIANVRPGSGSASLMACHVAEGVMHFQVLYQQGAYDLLGFAVAKGADCPTSAGLQRHDAGDIGNITTVGVERVNGAVYNNEATKKLVNALLHHPEVSTIDELTALMQ
ncbi:hypothetical protein CMO91_03955 [Candidatus Woesearchaeota archaeon]|nr:hypothetical protein [Candidatus Woesearchaeota archaeon]|tara:strand:- start:1004 stop:1957 length:954 start_codon:yes stop_codon:yes gene_type:complete